MDRPLLAAACIAVLVAAPAFAQPGLTATEQAAAFEAAGFVLQGGEWHSDCGDPGTSSYTAGAIDTVRDLNGDGRPEAVITEGSTYCYGNSGVGYAIVGKQANGSWRKIAGGTGIPSFLPTKGVAGWPDIEIGGPGFCFPVERWDGRGYVLNRHAYEGRPCKPPR